MIHFFTIVLNGMPFIRYHIKMLQELSIPWKWHIVEGVANLTHDTAWGVQNGGHIPNEFHNQGLSVDGTTDYLLFLLDQNKGNVVVYRKPLGQFWDGKIEMVRAPIFWIKEPCLLWQLDSDELWTKESVEKVYEMFQSSPWKSSAYFYCHYFFGPKRFIVTGGVKSTREKDWLRVWNFKPGMNWETHEPPVLENGLDNPIERWETLARGVSFQHFAYATIESVIFKEAYYGYSGAVEHWKSIQKQRGLKEAGAFRNWIDKGTMLDDWDESKNGKLLWNL